MRVGAVDLTGHRARRHGAQWLVLSVPFVLGQPVAPVVDDQFVRSLLINLVLFVVPGIPFAGIVGGRRGTPLRLRWIVPLSLLVFVAILALLIGLGVPATSSRMWNVTWLVTTLGCIVAAMREAPVLEWRNAFRRHATESACFLLAYVIFFVTATRIVPALGDHDDELQGTAHGIVTGLVPSLNTSRNTSYVFAHPPLAHFAVAGALLYYDELDWLARFDSRLPNALGPGDAWQRFVSRPLLAETRTPSLFFSAATVALLAGLLRRRTGLWWMAACAAAAYTTVPEVLVRSSYAGYFAFGSMFAMATLYASDEWFQYRDSGAWWSCFTAAGMAALTDHKLVLLPIGVVLWTLWQAQGPWRSQVIAAFKHPAVRGFLAGTVLFWLYGLAINPQDFWMDHIRHHIVDRVTHRNARGLDLSVYPSVPALWLEFLRDTGYLLVPSGLFVVLRELRRGKVSPDHPLVGFISAWALLTAVAFSVVDWRQTKHLAPIILPLVLGAVIVLKPWRPKAVVLIASAFVLGNGWTLYRLWLDFSSVVKVPEW